jgi:UDP-glucose 4-epimerase
MCLCGKQTDGDFSKVSKANSILLRYFNPVGAHSSNMIGEIPFDKPNNLVPMITQTAIGKQEKMFVWGHDYNTRDGSCIRDYIHVMDIASAHTMALDYLGARKNAANYEIFNVGSGNGITVLEAIHSFEKISGLKLNYEMAERRAGDVEAIFANNDLISHCFGWKAMRDLDEMMRSAWAWERKIAEND